MTVYFGLDFDDVVYPKFGEINQQSTLGHHYNGPKGILYLLETHLGLAGYPNDIEHLRIEKFRQALNKYLIIKPDAFFKQSYESDQLATANNLLDRRDELLLAGWNFEVTETTPTRLKVLAQVHHLAKEDDILPGYPDRFVQMLRTLESSDCPIERIWLNEPITSMPSHIQQLFAILKKKNIPFHHFTPPSIESENDLAQFRAYLKNPKANRGKQLKKDGSLLIVTSKRETDVATYLAKFFKSNTNFRPVCLIPEKNRALDNAFMQEGLPSLGILSDSLARPMLQMLKLVSAFIWKPIDPYKIMEFVTLPLKPLPSEEVILEYEEDFREKTDLGKLIAKLIAQVPGLKGERWRASIRRYFDALQALAANQEQVNLKAARDQYVFWFERNRYDFDKTAPKGEFIEIYRYIAKWAIQTFDQQDKEHKSLLVLSEQARRIADLLEALPDTEQELTYLQAERIVRTIYQSSPVQFRQKEVGALSYIHKPSALIGETSHLLWWNFIHQNPPFYFSKWYKKELAYFEDIGLKIQSPHEKSQIDLWQRTRPFEYVENGVILVMPEKVNGEDVSPHPLFGDLQAAFENIEEVVMNIDTDKNIDLLQQHLSAKLPEKEPLLTKKLHQPKPFINVQQPLLIQDERNESYSSLDSLFYYPYKWVFRYQIGLKKSSILSIVKEHTLIGNLGHRIFELLLKEEGVLNWSATDIQKWIDKQTYYILEREGATLLLYGKEPDRASFINKLKFSATNLLRLIRLNGWEIAETEKRIEGQLGTMKVVGFADLILRKPTGELAIIDLKWRGATRRSDLIKNKEDLQLVMYAQLLREKTLPHTAFYIIENGRTIARNNLAFQQAEQIMPQEDHVAIHDEIWERMKATYDWRIEQLNEGQIEVRTEETLLDLEDDMDYELLKSLLPMKSKNAFFDDYTSLINMLY